MTQIKLHGILAKEFGDTFDMFIERATDVFDAIDANRDGFKKRIFDLHSQGFDYEIIINKQKITSKEEVLAIKNPERIDIVPTLIGSGLDPVTWLYIATTLISIAAQILLAPKPPDPPEVSASTSALKKSFIFSGNVNRAAQGLPVPVGYGELIVGSEVIQATLKSFPQSTRSFDAFKNAENENSDSKASSSTSNFIQ